MILGVLKESKSQEGRVALLPEQAAELVKKGHEVIIQKGAGLHVGCSDLHYKNAGARIMSDAKMLISKSDLIIKVKEPTLSEVSFMRPGQILFCYLHLASMPGLLKKILKQKIVALGYETLQLTDKSLPLLKPMSEIAGKLATQNGAHLLRSDQGGSGVLLGGTEKVAPATVVILGGGTVGENAAKIALGMGAKTILFDVSEQRLQDLKKSYPDLHIKNSREFDISADVANADLLVGAALIPGAKAPKLVTKTMVKTMKKGSVMIDVAVDQGGCVETSVVTSHKKPVVVKFGVLHYGVPNMPGSVPVTATQALVTETYPYIERLMDEGLIACIQKYPEIKMAVNCDTGKIIHPGLLLK